LEIYFTKKISDIHLSGLVAALLCFFSAFYIYREYREEKDVFENGVMRIGVVENFYCTYSTRVRSTVDLNIKEENTIKTLKLNSESCFEISKGDTIIIKYLSKDKPILNYVSDLKKMSKSGLYFSIFCLLTGIFFIGCKDISMDYQIKKTMYKKGEKHAIEKCKISKYEKRNNN
jgi:hypothetical protein